MTTIAQACLFKFFTDLLIPQYIVMSQIEYINFVLIIVERLRYPFRYLQSIILYSLKQT